MIKIIPALILALIFSPDDALALQLAVSLVTGGLGFLIGGPLGAAIGYAAGSIIGGLLFPTESPTIKGPRLQDKTVQSAANGAFIMKTWGSDRVPAQIIFSSELKQHKHKTEVGGKGFGGTTQGAVTYTYSVDIMLSFGESAKGVRRLWADKKLIIDNTEDSNLKKKWRKAGRRFVIRDGNEDQLPSALEESYHGVGLCSAHRGLFCLEAEDFDLTALFLNHIPLFEAEIFTEGETGFGKIASYQPPDAPYSWWLHSFGYVDEFGELWALYYPFFTRWPYNGYAYVFHWTLDNPSNPIVEFHPLWDGSIVQESSISDTIRLRSDEPSAAVFGTNQQGVAMSYFRLEEGTRVDILQSNTSPNMDGPEIAVKYGDAIWVVKGNILYFGPDPLQLYKFDLETGLQLVTSDILFIEGGGGTDLRDLGRSESYLWALFWNKIVKLDPDTLAKIGEVDITNISEPIAMAVMSDAEIRIFSATAAGTKFYVWNGSGQPTLDQSTTEEGYGGIRGFHRFGLHYEGGMYIVDFVGFWGGFPAFIDFFADRLQVDGIPLWKTVRDVNIMCGLDSVIDSVPPTVGEIKVSELTDIMHGYTLTRPMSGRDAMVQLQACYFFDGRESNLKIEYIKRGKDSVRLIEASDLAARSSLTEELPDRLQINRLRETECPLRIHVIYNNHEAAYQSGHEYAPRQITDSRKTIDVEIAVAITAAEARQIADTHMAVGWLERETFSMKVSRKHMRLDAGDNIEIEITETLNASE